MRAGFAFASLIGLFACAQVQAPEPPSRNRLVFPGVVDLLLAPSHWIDPDCGAGDPKAACIVVSLDAPRFPEKPGEVNPVLDRYVEALGAKGWLPVTPDVAGIVTLRREDGLRCLQLASLFWDDGKSARIRWKEIIRLDLDPLGSDCANAERILRVPVHAVIPGHES